MMFTLGTMLESPRGKEIVEPALGSTDPAHATMVQQLDVVVNKHPEGADFKCPLSNLVMTDPVTAEDGVTYERRAIERWLEHNDISPTVRNSNGFLKIGQKLKDNRARKAALDLLEREEYVLVDKDALVDEAEPQLIRWDAHGLQLHLPGHLERTLALAACTGDVPAPKENPGAVSDMTSDLTKMFKILDPMRAELHCLVNLTPPKVRTPQ